MITDNQHKPTTIAHAIKLYNSCDFGIKYSAGKPIAYYPYHAGGSCFEVAGETNCNSVQEAKQVLRDKAMAHALEIDANDIRNEGS